MERRAAGALLALAACFACSAAAPTASNQTSLDLYEGAPEGCYYNFQHYGEGDRIMTNEPCLNCTCHNRMLMCYLRVCPFTKAIGQDCTVEKRADQCCPIVTCPDVPVDLLTSTSTTSPAEYGATGLGKLDRYGCSIHGKYFPEGSKVPPTPNKPCEHCYCIRNMTTCVMQECTLHVDGCTPIYHKDVCCPVRYSCDHLEDEMPLLDDMSTTVRPTPGFLLTTTTISPVTQMTQDCVHDDQIFADGALIKTEKACEHCYCMKGDIVCVVQECGAPMENEGKNCTSLPPREGQCCPDTYICEGDELSSEIPAEATTESVMEIITTLLPPRRVGVEGSGYRNEPDEALSTAMPTIESEIEGSGEDHDTFKPEGGIETISPTEDAEQFISVTKTHDEHEHSTTESDKNVEYQTLEPHDNVATTVSPIEKVTDKPVTDEITAELKPHDYYTTSSEKITTEYGEFLNTVPDEVHEVDDTKSHAESTTSETTLEGSGSQSPTENEDDKKTATSEKEEFVTMAAITSASDYNTPIATAETMTEKELSENDKDISRTTVAKVEEYTEKNENEIDNSTPEPVIPSSTNVPVEQDIKLTTEPDHAQNTVAVAEEETTDSHILKITSVPDSSVEGEKTTAPNTEQELTTEKTVQGEVSRPSEFVPTATTALRDNELSTEEPDKGLNTIPNEVNEEFTSAVPHLVGTKTTEPATQDVDMKQTTISETGTLTPEFMVTKGDHFTVTTEPSFRKDDESSVATKKPIDVSTTVRPEFVDEGLIPTSTHDEKIGLSSEVPTLDEDMTTLIPEYIKDLEEAEGSKQTTPELSVVTESVPVKHSEPSVDHEGETLPSTEKSTETTSFAVEDVETHEEPSRIPGEGDCLLNGVTYRNDSVVPSTNNCHTGCRCASSIIKCDPIICSPPPDYMDNCQSIYDSPDSCCPTYVCDHPRETVPPQSDNQMSGTESPLSSPTIECRGDQCEISEPVKQSTDRSEPCTGSSCSVETDHKYDLPHTSPTCENEEDCKSVDIPVQEATPCEGDSCKKVDCAGDNCDSNAIFVPEHTPQDIPAHDCTGEEPCRRKETSDTSENIPSVCDGPNCISETEITVQDIVYSSTKSSIPTEEITEKIEIALDEKTTEIPDSPTKDIPSDEMMPSNDTDKEVPEVNGEVDTKNPIDIDDETEKPVILDEADKETPIDTKETISEKPTLIDEDFKPTPTDVEEDVASKPALTDDDGKRTSAIADEITEKSTVTDEDIEPKPTVIEEDVTEKLTLADEDGKQKPVETQETVSDIPALTDDAEKESSTEIEEETTDKPSLVDDNGKVKPQVIDEDITEKPDHIDEEVKEKPTEIDEKVTEKPALTDDDGKIKPTVIDEEATDKPAMIDDDELKPTVIDEEVTKNPVLFGNDEKETSTDVTEQTTDKPAQTEDDRKVTSVLTEEITDKPAVINEDDEHKPPITDEKITGKPDMIDEDDKAKPTIIDEDVTDKPYVTHEDGKIKPTVIDEDVTDKPVLTDDGRVKPTDSEENITEKSTLTEESDKVQLTVIDEDVTGKPEFIDEDVKVKPTVIDEDVTGKPDFIIGDGEVKPSVFDEDVTGKPDLIDDDSKAKPAVIDEGKPDLIDDDNKAKPAVIDEDVTSKLEVMDEDGTAKPTAIDEHVTSEPDLIKEDGKVKPTDIDEDVTDKPALIDDDGRRKPTDTEEKITEKPALTDERDKVQPTVIDEDVTDKPVQIDEDGTGKPTDNKEEMTQKPILIDDDGIIIPTVIYEDITQQPALTDGKGSSAIEEESTEKPTLTDDGGEIKPTFADEGATYKPADTEEKVTEIPALIDDDGKGSSTGTEEEVTEKPALTDGDGKIKPSVINEDVTEKPIQTDEDAKYTPADTDEKVTEKPVPIDDDSKGTSPAFEDVITEKPNFTDMDIKETYTVIEEGVTEKSTLTDDNVKETPTIIDEEITDKPISTDDDSKIKPTMEEGITDQSINEVTEAAPVVAEEGSSTGVPEIERMRPETETKTPEISVHHTDSATSELQDVTKTPYESSTTLTAEDVHAFSTESNIEPVDVTSSAPKEMVPSESPEITKMPTKSQPAQEVTTVGTYETTPYVAITSVPDIEKETHDTTSPRQDIEEKPSTQASKLHDETESVEITTKSTIGEKDETSTDIPDLESLTTRKQEVNPVEMEPQEGPAGDEQKQPGSSSIDDEMTTKMYDEGKIKPVPESHVTEQAQAVTPAYDSISDLTEEPVQSPEFPEIPDSDKTKDDSKEKDKTITVTPISSADGSTEQQIPLATQKISEEDTLTTVKSYLPETGSTELPDKAIGEDSEHSTQTSEANKDKPVILTDVTEEPMSFVTVSQELFPTSEIDVISHGEKTTTVPDVSDQIHKGTTPLEEFTQEQDAVTEISQHHITTEEAHSKAPDTYNTDEHVTEIIESSTKSDGPKEIDSETIPTEIPRTSAKAEETTEPGESLDTGIKEQSVTEIQEQSTTLSISTEDLETQRPDIPVTSETPQSLVTGHSETTTSILKEESQEPELVTAQVQETTTSPELPVSVSVQEELQTEAPVSITEPGVKETITEIIDEISKVTNVPEDTVTEKHETLTTLRESSSPTTSPSEEEIRTEKPQVDSKLHETTESQPEISETTTDLIILEEHTHKIAQDITTELPTENEVTDITGGISTLSPHEEHTPKVPGHIPSESPIDEERTTAHEGTEHQYSESTEKMPGKEIEVATKETEVEMKPSEETPIEEVVTEKILETGAIEETTAATVQNVETKYTIAHNEYTTFAQTTPEALTDPAIASVSETGITESTTKEPSVPEKPTHETTVPEEELIFSTTKATTVREREEISDDKVAKPEDRPTETSEVPPTSTTTEVQKPSITDTQPTEKIPEPEEEFPSMGPNGYGEPDYVEEDQAFGPGTCRYGGKVYVSAQQIPRDDPCDFCFCFRSDIICLQQSCPPPIHGCHEEPIQGFCCPRYECPVSMATTVNVTTTTTTTTTTLPPHFPTHSYKGAAQRRGCQIKGHTYKVGEVVRSSSGPCLHCTCGGDGQMKCDPKACTPEPMLRQMIAAAVSAKRRR